jgi:hypothetical protein
MEISKEIIEEYLYDILGMEFKYAKNQFRQNLKLELFEYDGHLIGYYEEEDEWRYKHLNSLMFDHGKLRSGDITVWLRKKKLEKIYDK